MRININLASQPYEGARQFRRQMGLLIVALALVTVGLISYIAYQWVHSRAINRQLAQVRNELQSLDREESQARALLNKPRNRVVVDQSEFLNELFARKALSWTGVFTEMEKIMPANLHVVSMKPDYSKAGELVLHMMVATDSRDRAVELVRRMEKSPHFREPQVVAEAVLANSGDQSAGPGNIQFDIAAIYIPNAAETGNEQGVNPAATNTGPESPAMTPPASAAQGSSNMQAQNRLPAQRSH